MQASFRRSMLSSLMNLIIDAAVGKGADVVVVMELPLTPYFCQTQNPAFMSTLPHPSLSQSASSSSSAPSPLQAWLSELCTKYRISLVWSYYENDNGNLYNSVSI